MDRATARLGAAHYSAWVDHAYATCPARDECGTYAAFAGTGACVEACEEPPELLAPARAARRGARPCYFVLGMLCGMLLVFGLLQPVTHGGLMYRRHWCGVVMPAGGNSCLFM